jgi:hypothetical protein
LHPTKVALFWPSACVCHVAKPHPNKALQMKLSMVCDVSSICSLKTNILLSKLALRSSAFKASKRPQNASEIPTRQTFIKHHRKDKQMQDTRKRHPLASHFQKEASGFGLWLTFGHDSVRAPPPPLAKDMQTPMADGTRKNMHANTQKALQLPQETLG